MKMRAAVHPTEQMQEKGSGWLFGIYVTLKELYTYKRVIHILHSRSMHILLLYIFITLMSIHIHTCTYM
jgi:hypothetical protein